MSQNQPPGPRVYRRTKVQRIGDAMMGLFAGSGLVPHTYLLTTKGRRTGVLHTTPVTLVEHGGQRWLVAPYGPVGWVHNARAAGRVMLRRRGTAGGYLVRELPSTEAGPILKEYLQIASATRSYFQARKDSAVAEFVAEADRHPVFELTPIVPH